MDSIMIYILLMVGLLIVNPSVVFLGLTGTALASSYVCQCIMKERGE